MIKLKILASDFDNTIYYLEEEEKNKQNVKAIQEFVAKGNTFIIITGRNYTDIKVLLNLNQIPYTYLICEDGAKIFNSVDYCIDTVLLEPKEIKIIEELLNELDCEYYLDDGYNPTEYLEDVVKVVVKCKEQEEKEKIVKMIKEKMDIHIYASRYHVNIINRKVNKEKGLERLFELEKLNIEELRVIGDNDNDYEMLEKYSGGVIKKHHPILDNLHKKEYDTLKDYIEELMKD